MANAVGLPHIEFDHSIFDDVQAVIRHLQSSITIHAPYFSDYGFDLGSIETRGSYAEKFLKNLKTYHKQLGVRGVIIHPPDDPDGDHETYFNRLMRIKPPIHLENMPTQPWDDFLKFYHHANSKLAKNASLCFDVPHSFIANGKQFLELPERLKEELRSRQGYIHISGGDRHKDKHLPLTQGSAAMLENFDRFIQDIHFQGTLVMELRPRNNFLPWKRKIQMRLRINIGRRFVMRKARQLQVFHPSEED
jgi:sugar phosphate isomerase/epimerase